MASVNKINEVLAEVRGVPIATIEAYSRVLRREGILPETRRGGGATPMNSLHCAYMLAAIMRGSPTSAADNAREVGGLIAHDGGALTAPILIAQREVLGWEEGISFAEAVAWLLDRHSDGSITEIARPGKEIKIEIDRYWSRGWLSWHPTQPMVDALVRSNTEVFGDAAARVLDLGVDGLPWNAMKIEFHSPLLFQAAVSYREGDSDRNRDAHRQFREKKAEASKHDVWGNEWITGRTLAAISELLKT